MGKYDESVAEKNKKEQVGKKALSAFPHGFPSILEDPDKSEVEQLDELAQKLMDKKDSNQKRNLRGFATSSPADDTHEGVDLLPEGCTDNNAYHNSTLNTMTVTSWPVNYQNMTALDVLYDGFEGAAFKRDNPEVLYSFNLEGRDLPNISWLTDEEKELLQDCSPLSETKQQAVRELLEDMNDASAMKWKEAKTDSEKESAIAVTECNWFGVNEGILGYAPSRTTYTCGSEYGTFSQGVLALTDRLTDEQYKYRQVASGASVSNLVQHEGGHSIGLSHPAMIQSSFSSLDEPSGRFSYDLLSYDHESTMMSYNPQAGIHGQSTAINPQTPSKMDIEAMQDMYGADDRTPSYSVDGKIPAGPSVYSTVPNGYTTFNASGVYGNVEVSLDDRSGVRPILNGRSESFSDGGVSSVSANANFSYLEGLNGDVTGFISDPRVNYNQTSYFSVTTNSQLDTAVAGEGCNVFRGNSNNNTFYAGGVHTTVVPYVDYSGNAEPYKVDTVKGDMEHLTIDVNHMAADERIGRRYSIDQRDEGTRISYEHTGSTFTPSGENDIFRQDILLEGYTGNLTSCNFAGSTLGGLLPEQKNCTPVACNLDPSKVDFYPPEFGAYTDLKNATPP